MEAAVSGVEPRGQRLGVNVLFVSLLVIVVGSLAGQWLSVKQRLGGDLWYWFGHQGYEYVDLGRFWQIFLFAGLFIWLFLMGRTLLPVLRGARGPALGVGPAVAVARGGAGTRMPEDELEPRATRHVLASFGLDQVRTTQRCTSAASLDRGGYARSRISSRASRPTTPATTRGRGTIGDRSKRDGSSVATNASSRLRRSMKGRARISSSPSCNIS